MAASLAIVVVACVGCSALRRRHRADAAAEGPRVDTTPLATPPLALASDGGAPGGDAGVRFAPRWACRITGPGRAGRGPPVSVAPRRPFAEPGTIVDAVPLRDGRQLAREPVVEQGGHATLAQGRIAVRDDAGSEVAGRTFDVVPGAVEMLFEDAQGAGVAFWNGATIAGRYLATGAAFALPATAAELARACRGPVSDALRIVPVAPAAWEFPPVDGMPPSTADARWTVGRDATGLCIARLEGEGPWGRVVTEAATVTDGGAAVLRGELSLGESVNPVNCGPR